MAEDGSQVKYKFLATAAGKTRGHTVWISYDPVNGSGGYTSPPKGTIYDAPVISVIAYPNIPSYGFNKWSVTEITFPGSPVPGIPSSYYGNPLIKALSHDTEIVAVFQPIPQYTVAVQSENPLKGSAFGGGTCYAGGSVPVFAYPDPGWAFDGWYLNGSKVPGAAIFNYSPLASCTLIAKFKAQYTVTVQSEDISRGGAIGGGTCLEGDYVPLAAYPAQGWAFDGWYLNGSIISSSPSTYYQPSSSCTLIAKFIAQYTVTVQSEDTNKGTVYPPTATCTSGGFVNVSASPKSGYAFDGWYLNGSKISSSSTFKYYPSASCTLIAKFNPLPPSITGPGVICPGASGTFTAHDFPSSVVWTCSPGLQMSINGNVAIVTNPSELLLLPPNSQYDDDSDWEADEGFDPVKSPPVLPCPVLTKGWVQATSGAVTIVDTFYTQKICIEEIQLGVIDYQHSPATIIQWFIVEPTAPAPISWSAQPDPGSSAWICNTTATACAVESPPGASYKIGATVENGNSCNWTIYRSMLTPAKGASAPDPDPDPCPSCPVFPEGSIMVYPNPSSHILNVEIDREAIAQERNIEEAAAIRQATFEVRLYNVMGNLCLSAASKSARMELDISNLPNGIYSLHIYDGTNNKPEMRTIMVQH